MIVFDNQLAVTPVGKPLADPMPVAPVVVWVIAVNPVPTHNVGLLDAAVTVLFVVTVIVPVKDKFGVHPIVVTV